METTLQRFSEVSPEEFETEVNRLFDGVLRLKDAVCEQVRVGAIPPLNGLGILSCITGQTFQYGTFHGQPAPADLIASLEGRAMETARR